MTNQTIYKTTAKPLKLIVQTKWRKLLNIFHNEREEPYGNLLTETQLLIIDIIAKRRYGRTQIILPTQYGKSLAVALGVLMRASTKKEKWAIVAPTEEKARIIMDYVIEHIFDDDRFVRLLDYNGTKESLLRERSKTRITFRSKGEIRVFTANASNTQATKNALMGFGAPNVILDESPLTSDDLYATVKRMVGGTKDNFILEIGNPFFRNHFYRTWVGERYKKIYVNVWEALREGRYTQEYIDEMREEAMFDVLYECKFPEGDEIRQDGFRRLFTDSMIENSFIDTAPAIIDGDKPVLGVDPAHGGANRTALVVRYPRSGFALKYAEFNHDDVNDIVEEIIKAIKELGIGDYRTAVDAGGVGAGVADGLKAKGYLIKSIMFGEKATKHSYANTRAEIYWNMRKWIRSGDGKIVRDDSFNELSGLFYKENSSYKLQMMPKEQMAKEGIASPDTADAFALTFVDTSTIIEDDDIEFINTAIDPVEKMDSHLQITESSKENEENDSIIDDYEDLD